MGENTFGEQFEQLFICNGDVYHGFQVMEKIDEGNYGQVFVVSKDGKRFAMKVEPKRVDGAAPALKIEIEIMNKLDENKAKYFPKCIFAGADLKCHVVVMDLLGDNLKSLRLKCADPNVSSPGTWSRIGIQCLYVLKQMHDNGYLHHDIKPGNFAMGPATDLNRSRILHLLDFGISRSFTRPKKGAAINPMLKDGQKTTDLANLEFRPPKKKVTSLRGTPVYASPNAHDYIDLARIDDVWSLMYMIAEMVEPLPWSALEDEQLKNCKLKCKLSELFKDNSFDAVEQMLRSCTFYSFPNYELVYNTFKAVYDKSKSTWIDPYDWETKQMPSYVRWKQHNERRTSIYMFKWEYSDIRDYFRLDPYSSLQGSEKKKEKKDGGDTATKTCESPTVEEAKTPKIVMKKKSKISKPVKSKTKKSSHGKKK
ncbi:unnamed protein product [Caenorhabditis nigoni]|uniref:Protein kinase domain-containing protein n=1 Tax=Caenorhabditis nigoni TaxID=1611254 RepID=A0A2G5VL44_9PELO|nr:hypothetical protein B9Z55_002585 [Caenorhabditis nigoni]